MVSRMLVLVRRIVIMQMRWLLCRYGTASRIHVKNESDHSSPLPPTPDDSWQQGLRRRLDALHKAKNESENEKRSGRSKLHRAPKSVAWQELRRDILHLAQKNRYGSGKWLLFAPAEEIDSVWRFVAAETVQGKLGSSAKVMACGGHVHAPRIHPLGIPICVYVNEFWDLPKCLAVMDNLLLGWSSGAFKQVKCPGFKPCIFTELNIEKEFPSQDFKKTLRNSDTVLGPQPLLKWEEGTSRWAEAAASSGNELLPQRSAASLAACADRGESSEAVISSEHVRGVSSAGVPPLHHYFQRKSQPEKRKREEKEEEEVVFTRENREGSAQHAVEMQTETRETSKSHAVDKSSEGESEDSSREPNGALNRAAEHIAEQGREAAAARSGAQEGAVQVLQDRCPRTGKPIVSLAQRRAQLSCKL